MNIAKIVSSNSHIDYIARVIDTLDVADPPSGADYGFGTLVGIESESGDEVIGAVYNSMLMNPDYAGYGPRLSSATDLETFSPDFLNEQGCLLAIVLLGTMDKNTEEIQQGIPVQVVPAGRDVRLLDDEEIGSFHTGDDGISLNYYGHVVSGVTNFGLPLIEAIIEKLSGFESSSDQDRKKLAVLRQSLVWQRTVGQMRQ